MHFFESLIIIVGLIVFEIVSSVDNAIVNAHVLQNMSEKFRKIFLFWGILIAVFLVRGLLPFAIIWIANPGLSIVELWNVAFSSSGEIEKYLDASKPLLLIGGGLYLFLVFLSWLFLEEKKYSFFLERFIHRQSMWFYFISSMLFTTVLYFSIRENSFLGLAASIGSTAFFLTDGFKKNAEDKEKELMSEKSLSMSGWSKILYLEVLDTSFSIDGVIGAFAFTLSIPLILIGNGIGAFVVRELTLKGIHVIGRYAYLKNGAMYSIGILGVMMILESFHIEFPFWLAPVSTIFLILYFLLLSHREIVSAKVSLEIQS